MNTFFKKILSKQTGLIILADIAASALILKLYDIEELAVVFAFMLILLFSLCLCALFFTFKNILFYCYLNVVLAPLVFFACLVTQTIYLNHTRYFKKTISIDDKTYELFIFKQTGDFTFNRVLDSAHTHFFGIIDQNFVQHRDTIYLFYPNKSIYIYEDKLFGYTELKDTVLSRVAKSPQKYLNDN
jgi:hypothetical protein